MNAALNLNGSTGVVFPSRSVPRRRRHFRFHCQKDATVRMGSSRVRTRIVNASEAGVCVQVDRNQILEKGKKVTLDWTTLPQLNSAKAEHCVIDGTVIRSEENGGHASKSYVIKFGRLVRDQQDLRRSRVIKMFAAIGVVSIAFTICVMKVHNFLYFWYDPWLQAYTIGASAFVLSRVALSLRYKEPGDYGHFPTVSLIIAAKNEGAHIAKTVEHCFRANYPPDLMEIFAVDDGSTDDTWKEMEKLQTVYPLFKPIRLEKNMGKRHAMAVGAEKAHGDILVYVDSDSYIDPDSLYRLVQPFIDPAIGAVSGHVLAEVEEDNFISKMEAVRYFFSHRVMKAAESVYGAVTCCPGAYSAYRRSAVMRILPAWLNQTFWGTSATFGDDRSLTNFILRDYQVIYHAGARCVTYVPRTLRQFFRQQLRWKKSWSRETTVAVRIMYKKHPIAALFYYLGVLLTLISPLIAFRAVVYIPLVATVSPLPYILGVLLVYLFQCLICLYYTQSKYWYYGLIFAGVYIFFLSFQNYYAMATIHKNHWGTR